jgi:hypothetical protein
MVTQKEVKRLFTYINGDLYWNINKGRIHKGMIAGNTRKDGYCVIRINWKCYLKTHIIWLMFKGELPKNEISHLDGNAFNNTIDNLSDETRANNKLNMNDKLRADNVSGIRGVDAWGTKWRARCQYNGLRLESSHDTKEEASKGYMILREKLKLSFDGRVK